MAAYAVVMELTIHHLAGNVNLLLVPDVIDGCPDAGDHDDPANDAADDDPAPVRAGLVALSLRGTDAREEVRKPVSRRGQEGTDVVNDMGRP